MNINNPQFNAPVTFNEYASAPELAQIRELIADQSAENRELCETLTQLADSIASENKESVQKNAAAVIKTVSSSALANVLGGSILAFIQNLAHG